MTSKNKLVVIEYQLNHVSITGLSIDQWGFLAAQDIIIFDLYCNFFVLTFLLLMLISFKSEIGAKQYHSHNKLWAVQLQKYLLPFNDLFRSQPGFSTDFSVPCFLLFLILLKKISSLQKKSYYFFSMICLDFRSLQQISSPWFFLFPFFSLRNQTQSHFFHVLRSVQ